MAFEIEPYVSVGSVELGMTRDEVRAAVGAQAQSVANRGSDPPADFFVDLGMRVDYRAPGLCTFVEFGGPISPTFQEQTLLHRPYEEMLVWFEPRDPDLLVDEAGLRSPRFGIALYAPAAQEQPSDLVEGVAIFERGYYDVRRQSACAKLTLKTIRNVRVRAPKTSECVRRSVRNVRVRAPIHAECVHVDQRRRRLVEDHVRVKEDGACRREGVYCGLAQAL